MKRETLLDYFTKNPEYSYMMNNYPADHPAWNITIGSNKILNWYCKDCKQSHHQKISSKFKPRSTSPGKCLVCSGRLIITGVNDYATLHPEQLQEWDYDNNSEDPTKMSQYSTLKAHWKCSMCGAKWQAVVNQRVRSKYPLGCPNCNNKRGSVSSRAADILPFGKNVPNVMFHWYIQGDDENVSIYNKNMMLKWVCPKEGHTWEESPYSLYQRQTCPYCTHLVIQNDRPLHHLSLYGVTSQLHTEDHLCSHIDQRSLSYASAQRVTVICPQGHIYTTPAYVYSNNGQVRPCKYCTSTSSGEQEVCDFVEKEYAGSIIRNDRSVLNGQELDIYLPKKNIAVEYNGLYYHDDLHGEKDRWYHHNKWKRCQEQGIQLITIWEDDWLNRRSVVESMLLHKLGMNTKKVYARKTTHCEIDAQKARNFMDKYHIQGFTPGSLYYGLEDENGVLCALSIWRKNKSTLYLDRYATSMNVVGGMGKLLARGRYYAEQNGFTEIVTFASHEVSDGGLYEKLGFEAEKQIKPDYCYVYKKRRVHKFNFRKKRFNNDPDLLFDPSMSETQLAQLNKIPRIYDCGKTRYIIHID